MLVCVREICVCWYACVAASGRPCAGGRGGLREEAGVCWCACEGEGSRVLGARDIAGRELAGARGS